MNLKGDRDVVEVLRNGKLNIIDTEILVVGDIIKIYTGDMIPADCLVIKSSEFSVEPAGQLDEKPKQPATADNIQISPDPFVKKNSICKKGSCTALVLAVGTNTNQGEVAELDTKLNIES